MRLLSIHSNLKIDPSYGCKRKISPVVGLFFEKTVCFKEHLCLCSESYLINPFIKSAGFWAIQFWNSFFVMKVWSIIFDLSGYTQFWVGYDDPYCCSWDSQLLHKTPWEEKESKFSPKAFSLFASITTCAVIHSSLSFLLFWVTLLLHQLVGLIQLLTLWSTYSPKRYGKNEQTLMKKQTPFLPQEVT